MLLLVDDDENAVQPSLQEVDEQAPSQKKAQLNRFIPVDP